MKPVLSQVLEGLREGRQCYVVAPAIDENLELDIKGVTSLYEGMVQVLGKDWEIGLLHGRMTAAQKEDVMTRFKEGTIRILVSTTVIEVGIDVADATMMVIYDAHRFGLSTIHQLRGRCARGPVQGRCWLLSNTRDTSAIERLQKLEELKDGFAISEYDLQLRGPETCWGPDSQVCLPLCWGILKGSGHHGGRGAGCGCRTGHPQLAAADGVRQTGPGFGAVHGLTNWWYHGCMKTGAVKTNSYTSPFCCPAVSG